MVKGLENWSGGLLQLNSTPFWGEMRDGEEIKSRLLIHKEELSSAPEP